MSETFQEEKMDVYVPEVKRVISAVASDSPAHIRYKAFRQSGLIADDIPTFGLMPVSLSTYGQSQIRKAPQNTLSDDLNPWQWNKTLLSGVNATVTDMGANMLNLGAELGHHTDIAVSGLLSGMGIDMDEHINTILSPEYDKALTQAQGEIKKQSDEYVRRVEKALGVKDGLSKELLYGLSSVGTSVGLGFLTGGASMASVFGLSQAGDILVESKQAGKSTGNALVRALLGGTAEAGLEALQFKIIKNAVGKRALWKAGLNAFAENAAQEAAQQGAEELIQKDIRGTDIKDILQSMALSAVVGGFAGSVFGIGGHSFTHRGYKKNLDFAKGQGVDEKTARELLDTIYNVNAQKEVRQQAQDKYTRLIGEKIDAFRKKELVRQGVQNGLSPTVANQAAEALVRATNEDKTERELIETLNDELDPIKYKDGDMQADVEKKFIPKLVSDLNAVLMQNEAVDMGTPTLQDPTREAPTLPPLYQIGGVKVDTKENPALGMLLYQMEAAGNAPQNFGQVIAEASQRIDASGTANTLAQLAKIGQSVQSSLRGAQARQSTADSSTDSVIARSEIEDQANMMVSATYALSKATGLTPQEVYDGYFKGVFKGDFSEFSDIIPYQLQNEDLFNNLVERHTQLDLLEEAPKKFTGTLQDGYNLLNMQNGKAIIQSPIEEITINEQHLKHLFLENEESRNGFLNYAIRTIQAPNIIVKSKNYNKYIKLFSEKGKTKPHLQVIKVAKDGSFYVKNFRPTPRQVYKEIKEGQVVYDLSNVRNEQLSSSDITNISHSVDSVNYQLDPISSDTITQFSNEVSAAINEANKKGHKNIKVGFGKVKSWLAEASKRFGLDIDGYKHIVDTNSILHIKRGHGGLAEETRGQIPVTDEDIKNIPQIVSEPDYLVFGTKSANNREGIGYIKEFDDNTTYYVEEVWDKDKQLVAKTMYKKEGTTAAEFVKNSLRPTSKTMPSTATIVPVIKESVSHSDDTVKPLLQSSIPSDIKNKQVPVLDLTSNFKGIPTKQALQEKIDALIREAKPISTQSLGKMIDFKDDGQRDITGHIVESSVGKHLDNPSKARHSITLNSIEDLIKHSVFVEKEKNKKDWKKNVEEYYRFYVPVLLGKGKDKKVYAVRLVAEKWKGDNGLKTDVSHLYDVIIEDKTIPQASSGKATFYDSPAGLSIKISQLLKDVKGFDGDFYKQSGKMTPLGAYYNRAIYLFQKANRSTFLHEMSHWYLDIMNDFAGSNETARDVITTAKELAGFKGEEKLNPEQWIKVQETFARGFERYLWDGKAPNNFLTKAFEHLKAWFRNFYKGLKFQRINVKLSPEVRALYDQMLGGQEIDRLMAQDMTLKSLDEGLKKWEEEVAKARGERAAAIEQMAQYVKATNALIQSGAQAKNIFTSGGGMFNDWLRSISSRLNSISPELSLLIDKTEQKQGLLVRKWGEMSKPFFDAFAKLDAQKQAQVDFYLKNGLWDKVGELVGFQNIAGIRDALEDVYMLATESGVKLGWRADYAPRSILDYDGFLEATGQAHPELVKQMLDELGGNSTPEERAKWMDRHLSPRITDTIGSPGNLKTRTVDVVTPLINTFYKPSTDAIVDYYKGMAKLLALRESFGKSIDVTEDEDSFTDETVGKIINSLVEENKLTSEHIKDMREILNALYLPKSNCHLIFMFLRQYGYATKLSFSTMVRQFSDIGMDIKVNGLLSTLNAIFHPDKRITLQTLGIDPLGVEFQTKSDIMGRISNTFIRWRGINWADAVNKNIFLRSNYLKMQKLAKNESAFREKYTSLFGAETDTLIRDLKADKITEPVQVLLFHNISQIQPISKAAMPTAYLNNPNGRIMYMFKTFSMHRAEFIISEIIEDVRTGSYLKLGKDLAADIALIGWEGLIELLIMYLKYGAMGLTYEAASEAFLGSALGMLGINKHLGKNIATFNFGEIGRDFISFGGGPVGDAYNIARSRDPADALARALMPDLILEPVFMGPKKKGNRR